MIDPTKITNYNQTEAQLEENLLFWVFAAGHSAKSTAKGIDRFLSSMKEIAEHKHDFQGGFPFYHIHLVSRYYNWDLVTNTLGQSGLGCWRRKSRTVRELVTTAPHLATCTVDRLESFYGIGPKTARCFILHSRKGARVAGLDTHVLKFMKTKGYDVPKSTPTGKRYKYLEQEFLKLCDEVGKEPAEYDLEIWNSYVK